MRRLMSLVTKITSFVGSDSFNTNALLMILWSFLPTEKIYSALIEVGVESKTILNLPRSEPPSLIQSCRFPLPAILSMKRITSRAAKFLISFPTLNLSNSSNTVIGIATSFFLKCTKE